MYAMLMVLFPCSGQLTSLDWTDRLFQVLFVTALLMFVLQKKTSYHVFLLGFGASLTDHAKDFYFLCRSSLYKKSSNNFFDGTSLEGGELQHCIKKKRVGPVNKGNRTQKP